MKLPTYLSDLNDILEWIDIDLDGTLRFKGEILLTVEKEIPLESNLLHNLTNLLYGRCYTRSNGSKENKEPEDDSSILSLLREANTSAELFDGGWQVDEIESSGNIRVRKGGYKRYTFAGDFLREHFGQGALKKNELVKIKAYPEYFGEEGNEGIFYYVFGSTMYESNQMMIARLYFHVKPECAADLVRYITSEFNRFSIPFQFKCLNNASLYTRSDAAVLYLEKRYVNFVFDLLQASINTVSPWLNESIPMFTFPLAKGIGFAENPFSSDESFGSNRCRIVAQGILNAWKEKLPKTDWMESILQHIRKSFLIPEAFYLNPNSHYPYSFSLLEN